MSTRGPRTRIQTARVCLETQLWVIVVTSSGLGAGGGECFVDEQCSGDTETGAGQICVEACCSDGT